MAGKKTEWRSVRGLGQGNFGMVELWKNCKNGAMNAVKLFDPRTPPGADLSELKRLWRKEVELMMTISVEKCPYIVSAAPAPEDIVSHFGESHVPPILFMEYCAGGNLRQQLKLPENICGLPEADVLTILEHISNAITFLHRHSIIHRDLKPDNILRYIDSRNRIIYKLSDLGFAKDLSKSKSQFASTFVGTEQYVAPEIFMGKKYDKTVDYWSFGIIAFELMCGLRPFLHGEGPGNWLPLVEKKGKEVICISRDGDGQIVMSTGIPFYTRMSEVVKECLVSWLRTMLHLDPTQRGKKIGANEIVDLKLLSATLSTKFLEIYAMKERIVFPVGESGKSKISDIQKKIALKNGLSPENQLLLTADGIEVNKWDVACKYLGMDIYLIPKSIEWVRMKVRFPKTVNSFILNWDSLKDPVQLRKIWACAIYYLQAELEKCAIVRKSVEALKAWYISTSTKQLRAIQLAVEKAGSSLRTLLEMESRLEKIDAQAFKSQIAAINEEHNFKDSNYFIREMEKLQLKYKSYVDHWSDAVWLKPVRTTDLEELYYKVLKACSDWKVSDKGSPPFSYNEILVRSVCQFIVKGSEIDEAFMFNIRTQLEKVNNDAHVMEELTLILDKLNDLSAQIVEQRCRKQDLIFEHFGTGNVIVPSTVEKENSPPTNGPGPTINHVRGGGRRMCQSALVQQEKEQPLTIHKSGSMTVSLGTGLKLTEQCPLVAKLMQESQLLRAQTEESISSLSDSMEEIKELKRERESITWDFLK